MDPDSAKPESIVEGRKEGKKRVRNLWAYTATDIQN